MLAILSDIHSNLHALKAVLSDAKALGCKRFISLGDVAGYGAQPGECIEILAELGAINILGNHDSYIIDNENCPRSQVVTNIINYQRSVLKADHVAWLRKSRQHYQEDKILFVHGGPEDQRDQYLYTVSIKTIPAKIRWLISGHTHVQVLADFGECGYCNPGSVGQPRDGDNRAGYAIFNGNDLILRRVPYDIKSAVTAMQAAGFDDFYYENLYVGAQIGGRIDKIMIIK